MWAWHPAETNLRCAENPRTCMPSPNTVAVTLSLIKRADGHGWIDSVSYRELQYTRLVSK